MNRPLLGFLLLAVATAPVRAAAPIPTTQPTPRFEQHVRPILKAHCFECHGESAKPKAGLDLRLRRSLVAGGESGTALVPGKPGESLLFQRIRTHQMPPGKVKLSAVAEARASVGLSQQEFALLLGVSARTLQDWEQGRREPTGAARTLLKVAVKHPKVLRELQA